MRPRGTVDVVYTTARYIDWLDELWACVSLGRRVRAHDIWHATRPTVAMRLSARQRWFADGASRLKLSRPGGASRDEEIEEVDVDGGIERERLGENQRIFSPDPTREAYRSNGSRHCIFQVFKNSSSLSDNIWSGGAEARVRFKHLLSPLRPVFSINRWDGGTNSSFPIILRS